MQTQWVSPPWRRSYSLDLSETGRLLAFGGCCNAGGSEEKEAVFQDLWAYEPLDNTWSYFERGAGEWPAPRYGHSSVFVPKSASSALAGCLVIFGGRTFGNSILDDMWLWNEERNEWRQAVCGIERPSAACYSTLTLIDEGQLLLYGGQTLKSSRGSKIMWMYDAGRGWTNLTPFFEQRPRRFRHCAFYDFAQRRFAIYGGISGSAWHVDVYAVSLADLDNKRARSFKILSPATGLPETDSIAIQSEVCVNLDASHVLVLGAKSAHVLHTLNSSLRVLAIENELPTIWKGNSPGVHACLVAPHTILVMNLLSKRVSPILEIRFDQNKLTSRVLALDLSPKQSVDSISACHSPPNAPTMGIVTDPQAGRLVWLNGDRWDRWMGEPGQYFQLPGNPMKETSGSGSGSLFKSNVPPAQIRDGMEMHDFEAPRLLTLNNADATSSAAEDEDDPEDAMPLLYVRQQKQRPILKRIIDAMVEWEKRGSASTAKRRKRKQIIDEDDDVMDDEQDLECFGRSDADRKPFDNRHFFFTIFRGVFLFCFALFYLFSRRFSVSVKLALVLIGLVNIGCFTLPIIAYALPDAVDISGETSLVWAPLILYLLMVLIQATVEGNWRDNGGNAASIKYLDGYSSQVLLKQTHNSEKRTILTMRGGELVTNLIEYEESVIPDPWEYWFLCFIFAPFVGIVKAGLFIMVDYFLVSHDVVRYDVSASVHVAFAVAMLLNAVTTTAFLFMVAISAYIYRRQLRLLRLVSAIISKRQSAKMGIPYLPLRTVANVRVWSAMRTFTMSDRSYLPLVSANSITGFAFLILGILWIVLTVSVFVERSRKLLLVPLNISIGFMAAMLFYFAFVAIRQHFLINKALRAHAGTMGREKIRVHLAIDLRGEKSLVPTLNLMNHVHDILKIEMSYFRRFGGEINQNSMNSMLGFLLTLTLATLTNVVIDVSYAPAVVANATSV